MMDSDSDDSSDDDGNPLTAMSGPTKRQMAADSDDDDDDDDDVRSLILSYQMYYSPLVHTAAQYLLTSRSYTTSHIPLVTPAHHINIAVFNRTMMVERPLQVVQTQVS